MTPLRALAKFAAGQWGVVTRGELIELGLSAKQVKGLVARGHLHPLHRGVYAVGHHNVTAEGRWLAAVKACGDYSTLSHYAAASHHRWLRWDGRPVDVTCISRRRRPGINTHVTERLERVTVRRIPVTPRLRTITDLARTEPEPIVKRALRAAKLSEAELARLPTTGVLGRIVNLSTAPTASGNEDVVLDLVLNAGFAHPLVNVRYPGSNYIPDLWWRDARLIVEVDSREHHEAPLDQREDLNRQAWLEAKGERVLRTTKPQVLRDPQQFFQRLRAAGAPAGGSTRR